MLLYLINIRYAKPRSKDTEFIPGLGDVPCFRGDNINDFDPTRRLPDPERLLKAYFHSATTLNYVRSLLHVGFADLHHAQQWCMDPGPHCLFFFYTYRACHLFLMCVLVFYFFCCCCEFEFLRVFMCVRVCEGV